MAADDPETARIKAEWQHIVDVVRPERLFAYIRENYNTVSEFADAIGIAATSISRMRVGARGRKKIGEETAFLIERKLNLPRGYLDDDLRVGVGEEPPAYYTDLPPKLVESVRALQSVDEPMRSLITSLIQMLSHRTPPGARERRAKS